MASWFTPLGFTLIALGAISEYQKQKALDGLRGSRSLRGVGFVNAGDGRKTGVRSIGLATVKTLDQRVKWIRKGIIDDSIDPKVVSAARWIVSRKCSNDDGSMRWCVPPKNAQAEAAALFNAYKDPNSPYAVRYTNDHVEVDFFASAELQQRVPAEDCDGAARALGAMGRAIGFPARLVVVQTIHGEGPEHIWVELDLAKGMSRAQWYPLDPTEEEFAAGQKLPDKMIRKRWIYSV